MSARRWTGSLVVLGCLFFGARCDWAALEGIRRAVEGNSGDPVAAAAVEQRIAAVEAGLRTSPGASQTATLADRMEELRVPGVSIAVISGGRLEWAKAYGFEDADAGVLATVATRFQAASISKPVTAATALALVGEGALALDEDVNDFLTSWSVPANELTELSSPTTRRILSHTAGFTVPGFFGYRPGAPVPSLTQVLDGVAPSIEPAIDVFLQPGTFYFYSGGGFTVLQQAIQDVTGVSFDAAVRERIFSPARMKRSSFAQPLPTAAEAVASPHFGIASAGSPSTYPQLAAAGLWTTPTDLARFIMALQNAHAGGDDPILEPALAQEMLRLQSVGSGLGVFLEFFSPNYFWHSGLNFGFTAVIVGRIDGDVGAVVMTNGSRGDLLYWEVLNAIAEVYDWPDWRGLP